MFVTPTPPTVVNPSHFRRRAVDWGFVRRCLRSRREAKRMASAGYRKHETDWEIHRGCRTREIIVDAQISCCGKYVWTKIGPDERYVEGK